MYDGCKYYTSNVGNSVLNDLYKDILREDNFKFLSHSFPTDLIVWIHFESK